MILSDKYDPMGLAISEFHRYGTAENLRILSSLFEEDEMSVATLFRKENDFPPLELTAINLTKSPALDVGAGAGCHSLALQNRGVQTTAIDISPLSVETMRFRGIRDARLADFFKDDFGQHFSTIILLMNGLGIAGKLARLPHLLRRCYDLLRPGGFVLTDSSDIGYIFEDENTGEIIREDDCSYYGEVDFQMVYKDCFGHPFDWVYVDSERLTSLARAIGFFVEIIQEGENNDYLARLTKPFI